MPNSLDWGFYGHRLINEHAVYALPDPLRTIFMPHVMFLREHAVDADKRRYAVKTEAFQHYIDLESWQAILEPGSYPNRRQMLTACESIGTIEATDTVWSDVHLTDSLFIEAVPAFFCDDQWTYEGKTYLDTMTYHGVLPITIMRRYHQLVSSFRNGNMTRILKHAADLGHYIGDAHVPLHTTVNYNGQLTGQTGIHAFWETSIPELLAAEDFDLIVGRAVYVSNIREFAWTTVIESHQLVSDVLTREQEVRHAIRSSEQKCPVDRSGTTTFSFCPDYVRAYHHAMDGMVAKQMKKAVRAIADIWWSAYVDAGQPVLVMGGQDSDVLKNDLESVKPSLKSSDRRCR